MTLRDRVEKYCKPCDSVLPIENFSKSNGRYDGVQAYCIACMKISRRESYRNNPEAYKARAKAVENKMRKYLHEVKSQPCMDCGISYPPYVMDLDHRDKSTKIDNVSQMLKLGNLNKFMLEIEKCDVVCANCHRERTWGLTGNMRV